VQNNDKAHVTVKWK